MAKKQTYQKPTIERIKLTAEEAVLQGCKMSVLGATNGPGNFGSCGYQWQNPVLCYEAVS